MGEGQMTTDIAHAQKHFDAIQRLHESARARGMSEAAIARLPKLPVYEKPFNLPPPVLATAENGTQHHRSAAGRKGSLARWPERTLSIGDHTRLRWQNPAYREMVIRRSIEKRWSPDQRAKHSERMRQEWVEGKRSLTAAHSVKTTPAYRKAMSKVRKADWANPEYRERMLEALKISQPKAVAASLGTRRKILPPRGSAEYLLYAKLRGALGPKAAREAMGIGP
jgi:hypothetical protein